MWPITIAAIAAVTLVSLAAVAIHGRASSPRVEQRRKPNAAAKAEASNVHDSVRDWLALHLDDPKWDTVLWLPPRKLTGFTQRLQTYLQADQELTKDEIDTAMQQAAPSVAYLRFRTRNRAGAMVIQELIFVESKPGEFTPLTLPEPPNELWIGRPVEQWWRWADPTQRATYELATSEFRESMLTPFEIPDASYEPPARQMIRELLKK